MKLKIQVLITLFAICLCLYPEANTMTGISGGIVAEEGTIIPFGILEFDRTVRNLKGESSFERFNASGSVQETGDGQVRNAQGNLGILLTRASGMNVLGIKLQAAGIQDSSIEYENLAISLSLPITRNGRTASWHIEPQGELNPLEDGYYAVSTLTYLSFSVKDCILKPGGSMSLKQYKDGTKSIILAPSLDISWYPGFPLSAGGWAEYEFETVNGTTLLQSVFNIFLAVSPLRRVLIEANSALRIEDGVLSTDSKLELVLYPGNSDTGIFSIPVTINSCTGENTCTTLGLGIRYEF